MNKSDESELFERMPVVKAILTLAVPTVISQLITIIYNMADTFFIGQLGDPNEVAAATLAMPLFTLMTAISNLFGIGGASLISRLSGRGELEKAKRTSAFCVWTGAFTAFAYGLIILLTRGAILPALGADSATFELTSSYLFWTIGIGALPTVMNPELAHLIRSEGHSKEASFGVALGGILNIVLDPLFIFVFRMNITGAAIATLLSNAAAMVYFIVFIHKRRKISVITLSPKYYTLGERIPAEVVTVGIPSFLISMTATVSNLVLNRIIAGYSNAAVAGMGIAKKVNMLAFAVAQGITQGTLPLIGYNYTSGDRERMMKVIKALFVFCVSVALVITVGLYVSAESVSRLFIDDETTAGFGELFLHIICCACTMSSVTFFSLTVFQATGKKIQPLILSVLRKGTVDLPFMVLFNHLIGINGVAWATPVAEVVSMTVSLALVVPYIIRLAKGKESAAKP